MMGMKNYTAWRQENASSLSRYFGKKYTVGQDWNRRTGPNMDYSGVPPCDELGGGGDRGKGV